MDTDHGSAPESGKWNQATQIWEGPGSVGAPAYFLRMTGSRLCVERSVALRGRREFTAYVCFQDEAAFQNWCDSDIAAVARPNLRQRLRRAAETFFDGESSRPLE